MPEFSIWTGRASGGERIAQVQITPSQVGRQQHLAGIRIHHSGHDDADTLAAAEILVLDEDRLDALDQAGDELLPDRVRWKLVTLATDGRRDR